MSRKNTAARACRCFSGLFHRRQRRPATTMAAQDSLASHNLRILRRSSSFRSAVINPTHRHTPDRKDSDRHILGAASLKAQVDFEQCIITRNTRVDFDWSNRYQYPLNDDQQRLLAECHAALQMATAGTNPAPDLVKHTGSTITLDQALILQQQFERLCEPYTEHQDSLAKRLNDALVYRVRRQMYFNLAKAQPATFAAITEIINTESGPVAELYGRVIFNLAASNHGYSITTSGRHHNILIESYAENQLQFTLKTIVLRTDTTTAIPQAFKIVTVHGRCAPEHLFDGTHPLWTQTPRFSVKDYTAADWEAFEARRDAAVARWRTQSAIAPTLTKAELDHIHDTEDTSAQESKSETPTP